MDIRHRTLLSFAPLLTVAVALAVFIPLVNAKLSRISAQQLRTLSDLVDMQDMELSVLSQRETVGQAFRGFNASLYALDYASRRDQTLAHFNRSRSEEVNRAQAEEGSPDEQLWQHLAAVYAELDAQHAAILGALQEGDTARATSVFYGKAQQLTHVLLASARAGQAQDRERLDELEVKSRTLKQRALFGLAVGVGGGIFLAVTFAWLLISEIVRPIERLAADAARYASGDVSGELSPVGKIKQLKHLRDAFQHLLGVTLARQDRLQRAHVDLEEQVAREQQLRATVQALNEDLERAKDELERRVEERTGELTVANERLQVELVERGRAEAALKASEEELRQLNEALEQRVVERTAELAAAQRQLLDTARRAGMAEVATNVVHNIGNVLNTVNVSAKLIAEELGGARLAKLERAAQLLASHKDDPGRFLTEDERGRHLIAYLKALAATLQGDRLRVLSYVEQLGKSVDHIKDIVRTQQTYAGTTTVVEPVQLSELVEDALRMNDVALTRPHIKVVKDFACPRPVYVDKHRLLQILMNLISNAKYAMDELPGQEHELTLRVEAGGTGGEGVVRISVRDSGVGIAREHLTRIFSHGFTTRRGGHGFGLHSCALAAKEMSGTLSARSDGAGHGATFTLELRARLGSAAPPRPPAA
ncbi:ATP-binding protein [Sorangium sp. So ce1389]|uniref:sensor histidine kinase n=1 Tax=Sorangium sp. So ce1389 TaxID=3133336 RepID=UPI003F5EF89D